MFCNMCGASINDEADFCPNCGANLKAFKVQPEPENISAGSTAPMMDIPIAEAPADDAEADTTVLTADMSGPLTMNDAPATEGFADVKPEPEPPVAAPEPEIRQHQPQVPDGMVVTPAPVTGSSILSDDSVTPASQKPEAPQPTVQPAPQPQPVQNAYGQMGQQNIPYAQPYGQPQAVTVINQVPADNNGKLITPLGYIGYNILFSIPIVGLILLFVWGFGSSSSQNLKNYCRSFLLLMLISIILSIILAVISIITGAEILSLLDF